MTDEHISDRLERRGFFVADWHVQPLLHRISRGGKTKQIEPKLIDVLIYLARNAGSVVTRDQLLEDVWPDTIVTDHALTRSISEIRKAFDDSPKDSSIIETIPKTGYRLVAPVTFEEPSSDGLARETSSVAIDLPHISRKQRPRKRYMALAAASLAAAVLIAGAFAARSVLTNDSTSTAVSRPLTTLPGREIQPTFSPDGSMLAFVWAKELFESSRQIYVTHLNGDAAAPISSGQGQDMFPAWSPDGKRVAFIRNYNTDCAIFVVTMLGTSEQKLIDCPFQISELDWSPDGKYLTFVGPFGDVGPQRVYLLDIESRSYDAVTDPPSHFAGDDLPVFSPDGRHLSFVRSRAAGVNDLYTIDLENPDKSLKRLTPDGQHIYAYDWTPNGREILFSSNRDGLYRVWRVPRDGGVIRTADDIRAWDPGQLSISASGNSLAFVEWFFDVNIREFPLPGAEPFAPKTLLASTRTDANPAISPDGKRVAFTTTRSGANEVWVADADGSHLLMLTTLGRPYIGGPAWSPDGRYLAFSSREGTRVSLQVVDSEGGAARVVDSDTTAVSPPAWSQDGSTLYYASSRTGDFQIWKIALTDGAVAEQVTTNGGRFVKTAADGRTLYLAKSGEPGLWAFDLETGMDRKVVDPMAGTSWTAWTLADDGIYVVERNGDSAILKRYSFDGETATTVMSISCTPMDGGGAHISPDRTSILLSCIDRADSDIMLVEGFR